MTAKSSASLLRQRHGVSVLYVDDDARVCSGMRRLLTGAGVICHVANTHDDAVGLLGDARRIDLAILDYQMPDGDVAALVRRLRAVRPGIALFGTSGANRREAFSRLGVEGFIQKPWELDDVIRCLDSRLSLRDVRDSDAGPDAYGACSAPVSAGAASRGHRSRS